TQKCEFDKGLYVNPGPWRIPYHHTGILDYCHQFGVALEPFIQVNYNAYFHSPGAYGGRPQRIREVQADFHGNVAEPLAKAVNSKALDQSLTKEDGEKLIDALASWGALDEKGKYGKSFASARRRGFQVPFGGGLMPPPEPSTPGNFHELLASGL